MTEIFRLFVRGEPKAKGSKRAFVRGGKPILVEANPDAKPWQRLIQDRLAEFQGEPWVGPMEVILTFQFVKPASAGKRTWPHVRPDLDKLARAVLDALERAKVILDDAQIVSLVAEKRYSAVPGVEIELRKL